jgi:two-component system, cell cycle response regulator DivK
MSHVVLYIEDNPDNMTLVRRALEARGYTFVEAINGLQGVEVAETKRLT